MCCKHGAVCNRLLGRLVSSLRDEFDERKLPTSRLNPVLATVPALPSTFCCFRVSANAQAWCALHETHLVILLLIHDVIKNASNASETLWYHPSHNLCVGEKLGHKGMLYFPQKTGQKPVFAIALCSLHTKDGDRIEVA